MALIIKNQSLPVDFEKVCCYTCKSLFLVHLRMSLFARASPSELSRLERVPEAKSRSSRAPAALRRPRMRGREVISLSPALRGGQTTTAAVGHHDDDGLPRRPLRVESATDYVVYYVIYQARGGCTQAQGNPQVRNRVCVCLLLQCLLQSVRIRPPEPTRRQRPTIPPLPSAPRRLTSRRKWRLSNCSLFHSKSLNCNLGIFLIFFLTRTSISSLFHWRDHISRLTATSS